MSRREIRHSKRQITLAKSSEHDAKPLQDKIEVGHTDGVLRAFPASAHRSEAANYDYQACDREKQAYQALQRERDSLLQLLDELVFMHYSMESCW